MTLPLPNFQTARILIVGDVMLDRYWHGKTQRISPEAPVPVVTVEHCEDRPGGAANVALNVAHLGAQVHLIGITGKDDAAFSLQQQLTNAKVHCHFYQDENIHTITKLRAIAQHQQLIRLDFEKDFSLAVNAQSSLMHIIEKQLTDIDLLVLSDYAKGTLNQVQQLIQLATGKNIPVIVDPKGADFDRYRNATLITPNLKEFETIVGPCKTEADIICKGQRLLEEKNWEALLITRSEQGMTLLQRNKKLQKNEPPVHFRAQAKEVFDVTGAGDTVIATLATCLATGIDFTEATQLANIAAGIVVSKLGTASVSAKELSQALDAQSPAHHSILTEEQLLQRIQEARAKGETLVMTNGCFDLLHPGHISYLETAKKLGDRLIIAVNNDASVKKLKGPSRPINPLHHRMTLLAALACVDWVVSFSEETPKRLIEAVLPDILVKGGDYEIEQIAGAEAVLKNHGQVKIIPFLDGHSSTGLIEKIKKM